MLLLNNVSIKKKHITRFLSIISYIIFLVVRLEDNVPSA